MSGDTPSLPRTLTWLAVIIAVWWIAPGALRRMSRETFYEFQAPLFQVESRLKDLRAYWELSSRSNHELIEAGRDLARANAELALQLARYDRLAAENRRLEAALDLPSKPRLRQVVARVARRDIGRWWSRIILAKGANHGIRKDCAVVNGGGIVGRVIAVHAASCEVELATDPGFRISALVEGDDRPVIFSGTTTLPFAPPEGLVTHIPSDFAGEPGVPPKLVTSGIGGIFQIGGLYIGTLETEPAVTADGLFREARVRVRTDLHNIAEATVLVPVERDLAVDQP